MDKKKLDNVFKVVIAGVAIVFIAGKVFSISNFSSTVYGNQDDGNTVTNPLYTTGTYTTTANTQLTNENSDYQGEGAVVDGVQVIKFDLESNAYPNLNVTVNQPVRLVINVSEENLNSCNYVMQSADFGFEKKLEVGENIVEFTPTATGEYIYSCWMGMVGAYITVTDGDQAPSYFYGENVSQGGCCSFR